MSHDKLASWSMTKVSLLRTRDRRELLSSYLGEPSSSSPNTADGRASVGWLGRRFRTSSGNGFHHNRAVHNQRRRDRSARPPCCSARRPRAVAPAGTPFSGWRSSGPQRRTRIGNDCRRRSLRRPRGRRLRWSSTRAPAGRPRQATRGDEPSSQQAQRPAASVARLL